MIYHGFHHGRNAFGMDFVAESEFITDFMTERAFIPRESACVRGNVRLSRTLTRTSAFITDFIRGECVECTKKFVCSREECVFCGATALEGAYLNPKSYQFIHLFEFEMGGCCMDGT